MRTLIVILLAIGISSVSYAQYFGQNKPTYEQFDFKLYKTPHFELYHYINNVALINEISKATEKWYFYHQQVLQDTFKRRNPIIFYSNHAHFQQTTAISSRIEVGTGGVTEGMKRRVVMPVAFTKGQTDHVLGHELVHAFQYHMLTNDEQSGLMAINNIPLWMVEGMAEYLSLGSVNSQTVLWIRDALINNHFPTLGQMTRSYRYSPYRYGHAFWAFIAYKYGEQYIPRLFKATARKGYQQAISDVLMLSPDSLSVLWRMNLKEHLLKAEVDSTFSIVGERLLSKKNSGRYNLNPGLSPDGKTIVFLSERDLYGIDLFMADAEGNVKTRLFTSTAYDQIDAINYLETGGAWSPDSRYFAFMVYKQGRSKCLIFDTQQKEIWREIDVVETDEINWPVWSPDGNYLAFSGLRDGLSDIYIYDLETSYSRNLTNNVYAAIQPCWTPDGKRIIYVTDEELQQEPLRKNTLNIASIDVASGYYKLYQTFTGAQNLNPIVANQGRSVLFLSNRDGRRNLYQLNVETNKINQLTNYPTGISGMTDFSPALTLSNDTLCYSMLWKGHFSVFKTTLSRLEDAKEEVKTKDFDRLASRLLPYSAIPSQVETNLYFNRQPLVSEVDSFYNDQIANTFKLDYIGNVAAGVMTGRFGTGMAGSIEAHFSDVLGRKALYTALSINGEIYDFGGQVAYLNQKNRVKMGVGISHIPYRSGSYQYQVDSLTDGSTQQSLNYLYRRTFEDKLSFFTFIPINKTKRFEVGASYAFYNYRIERFRDVSTYSPMYSQDRERMPSPDGFSTGILDGAFVIDNARMGLASPVEGKRLRIQLEHYVHKMQMQTLLFDFRRYFFVKPYTLAFRLYHYGRYGRDSDSERMLELFIGSPWYIRGYDMGDFYGDESENPNTISLNQLIGSRMIVSNLEWRLPFTGPKELAWIRSKFLFSELALFVDGGISWNKASKPVAKLTTRSNRQRIPVFSTGLAYRINLFGVMVLEPYYGFPYLQKQFKKGEFGINIFSGW